MAERHEAPALELFPEEEIGGQPAAAEEKEACSGRPWSQATARERVAQMRAARKLAQQIVKAYPGRSVPEAALEVAAAHMYEVLVSFEPALLTEMLKKDPREY